MMNRNKTLKKWLEWTYAADPDNSVDPDTIEGLMSIRTPKTTKKDHRIFNYYGSLTRFEVIEGYNTRIAGDYRTVAFSLTALEVWLEKYREFEPPLRQFLKVIDYPAGKVPDCVFAFLKEVYLEVLSIAAEIVQDFNEKELS